jgi:hypothetical protein
MPSDGCYRRVGWPDAGCNVEIAIDAALAAPPLGWAPCAKTLGLDVPGCDAQMVTWWNGNTAVFLLGTVTRWGAGYRVGYMVWLQGTSDYQVAAVYDENDKPVQAWRMLHAKKCVLDRPLVTPTRVWLGADNTGANVFQHTAPTWAELGVAKDGVAFSSFHQYWASTGDWMVAHLSDGATLEIADTAGNTAKMLVGAFGHPRVVGDYAFGLIYPRFDFGQFGLWSRKTGAVETVVETEWPERVKDANSDGKTLVWITQNDNEVPGWLWTSPFAANKGSVVAMKRRATPPIRIHLSAAGGGHYAMYSVREELTQGPGDGKIHIYRLSDAIEWSFAVPDGLVREVLHVDETHLFLLSNRGFIRVRLDALGPGTPP